MAPERNGKGRGKTNCFFDKRVKPKNLAKVEQIERKKKQQRRIKLKALR